RSPDAEARRLDGVSGQNLHPARRGGAGFHDGLGHDGHRLRAHRPSLHRHRAERGIFRPCLCPTCRRATGEGSMTRRAARITHAEIPRRIEGAQDSGPAGRRVTVDGNRVDVIVNESVDTETARTPESFQTLEEYEAWRAQKHGF